MAEFNRFDPSASCHKCGYDGVTTFYHRAGYSPEVGHGTLADCLIRRCMRCGYAWPEACVDAVQLEHIQMKSKEDEVSPEVLVEVAEKLTPQFTDEDFKEVATAIYNSVAVGDPEDMDKIARLAVDATMKIFWKKAIVEAASETDDD